MKADIVVVKKALARLAGNMTDLRGFLRDPEAWIDWYCPALGEAAREELKRVAEDSEAFIGRECHVAFGADQSEVNFMSGESVARRQFLVVASSMLLSAPLAALTQGVGWLEERRRVRGEGGQSGALSLAAVDDACHDEDCEDETLCLNDWCDDNECVDTSCLNAASCQDDACDDAQCNNNVRCKDDPGCFDNPQCYNGLDCYDDHCTDRSCTNAFQCNDKQDCHDIYCINQNECTDGVDCTVTNACVDQATC